MAAQAAPAASRRRPRRTDVPAGRELPASASRPRAARRRGRTGPAERDRAGGAAHRERQDVGHAHGMGRPRAGSRRDRPAVVRHRRSRSTPSHVIEDDVASVREALLYPARDEMWQLCGPGDLGALDVTAPRAVGQVRLPAHQERAQRRARGRAGVDVLRLVRRPAPPGPAAVMGVATSGWGENGPSSTHDGAVRWMTAWFRRVNGEIEEIAADVEDAEFPLGSS